MVLSSMIRRAPSSVLPLAIRAVGSPRSFHGAIAMSVNVHEPTTPSLKSSSQSHCYSSAASPSGPKKLVDVNLIRMKLFDQTLIRIINSKIKRVKETPKGFPFAIEISTEGTVILTREDGDEHIKVEVEKTALEDSVRELDNDSNDSDNDDTADDSEDDSKDYSCEEADSKSKSNDSDDDSCDDSDDHSCDNSDDTGDDSKKANKKFHILMTASVCKGNELALEFDVVASADNLAIQSLAIKESTDEFEKYEGPGFWNMDPELKDAFHRYLEIRKINPSMIEGLQMYMKTKKSKENTQWLKKLRRFIKK